MSRWLSACILSLPLAAPAQADDAAGPPLSPAQIALFETPHLAGLTHPETLAYRFVRDGAGAFTDDVSERILQVHPDGSKLIDFNFLSGERHVFYPAVDDFRGNPILMIFLEHDVQEMREETGIPASYLRNRVRQGFVDRASVAEAAVKDSGGSTVPGKRITLAPFRDDPRLAKLPPIRDKIYVFLLSDQVPGGVAEIRAEQPADPAENLPAMSETLRFAGEKP